MPSTVGFVKGALAVGTPGPTSSLSQGWFFGVYNDDFTLRRVPDSSDPHLNSIDLLTSSANDDTVQTSNIMTSSALLSSRL